MANTLGRVRDVAERLSNLFQQLIPLDPAPLKGRRQPAAKDTVKASENALKRFFEEARQERARHHLGFISRARVAFGLQQRLLQAGYPPPLVKQVLFAMLTSAFVGDKQ